MYTGLHVKLFDKYPNIQLHENLSIASGIVPCEHTDGRTDGHDEADSRYSQLFCERA
jgi:hypothetical protein